MELSRQQYLQNFVGDPLVIKSSQMLTARSQSPWNNRDFDTTQLPEQIAPESLTTLQKILHETDDRKKKDIVARLSPEELSHLTALTGFLSIDLNTERPIALAFLRAMKKLKNNKDPMSAHYSDALYQNTTPESRYPNLLFNLCLQGHRKKAFNVLQNMQPSHSVLLLQNGSLSNGADLADPLLDSFIDLKSVEEIDLSGNRLPEFKSSWLKLFTGMKKINLRNNNITSIGWDTFCGLPDGTTLSLCNNQISTVTTKKPFLKSLITSPSGLTVDISGNSGIDAQKISQLEDLLALSSLQKCKNMFIEDGLFITTFLGLTFIPSIYLTKLCEPNSTTESVRILINAYSLVSPFSTYFSFALQPRLSRLQADMKEKYKLAIYKPNTIQTASQTQDN